MQTLCRSKGRLWCRSWRCSPNISGGGCAGKIDISIFVAGNQPRANYVAPRCPQTNCGVCYKVTNKGGHKGAHVGGIGNSVTVQIIDSCPATNAWNFCKTNIPPKKRCGSASTNQLDIDKSAYKALTGKEYGFVSAFRLIYDAK